MYIYIYIYIHTHTHIHIYIQIDTPWLVHSSSHTHTGAGRLSWRVTVMGMRGEATKKAMYSTIGHYHYQLFPKRVENNRHSDSDHFGEARSAVEGARSPPPAA